MKNVVAWAVLSVSAKEVENTVAMNVENCKEGNAVFQTSSGGARGFVIK